MSIMERKLTVCTARHFNPRERVPSLVLQGKWLKRWGIEPGDKVAIGFIDEGVLVVEKLYDEDEEATW